MGLTIEKYSPEDLKIVSNILLQKVNENKGAIVRNGPMLYQIKKYLTDRWVHINGGQKICFPQYRTAAIKTSLWGWLGNYLGFYGYYNPFTGEGQVNTTIPKFLQPYITCHEIAHQLGYAKENEANFVGYLAAASSKDASFFTQFILIYSYMPTEISILLILRLPGFSPVNYYHL